MTVLTQAVAIGDNEIHIDAALSAGQVPGYIEIDDELLNVGGQDNMAGTTLVLSTPAKAAHDNGATVTYAGRPYDPTFKTALAGADGEQTIRLLTFDVAHTNLVLNTPFNGVHGLFLGAALTSSAFIGAHDVVTYSMVQWAGDAEIKLWIGAADPANIGDTAGDFYARPLRVTNTPGPAATEAALAAVVIPLLPTDAAYRPNTQAPASIPVGSQLYVYLVDNAEAGLALAPTAGTERIWIRVSEPAA